MLAIEEPFRYLFHMPFSISKTPGMKGALVVKAPAPSETGGASLRPHLTGSQSAALRRRFLADTIETTRDVEGMDFFVARPPQRGEGILKGTVPGDYRTVPRIPRDISRALPGLFRDLFDGGYEHVVVLSGTSPDLPACLLEQGTELLSAGKADFVIGPSERGGFYLVGLGREHCDFIGEVDWNAPDVCRSALRRAKRLGLRSRRLPEWYDISSLEDLRRHLTYYGLRLNSAAGCDSHTGRYLLTLQDRIFPAVC